jgi:hypothetical protein
MSPSELKQNYLTNNPNGLFFNAKNMKFAGDTMMNYGVRHAAINGGVECWELYRKRPVKHGLQTSAYFDKQTFKKLRKED